MFASPAVLTLDEVIGKMRDYGNSLGIIDKVNDGISAHEFDGPAEFKSWAEKQLTRLKARYEEQGA